MWLNVQLGCCFVSSRPVLKRLVGTVEVPLPLGYGWIEAVIPLLVVVCFPIDRGSANFVLKHGRHVCVLTLGCPSLVKGHGEVSLG